jgi:HEPN domain-containing protein
VLARQYSYRYENGAIVFKQMATTLTMSRQEVMKYWSDNKYAGMMIFAATDDYTAARCCIGNALFSGFILAAQAIEKLLKALIYLESGKGLKGHNPFELKEKLKGLKDNHLDQYDDVLKKLHDHYQGRYYDNVTTGKGASSEELLEIDALWLELMEKMPVPDEAKYRTAFFSFLAEPNPHWHNDFWLKTGNAALAPQLISIIARYQQVKKHLHP